MTQNECQNKLCNNPEVPLGGICPYCGAKAGRNRYPFERKLILRLWSIVLFSLLTVMFACLFLSAWWFNRNDLYFLGMKPIVISDPTQQAVIKELGASSRHYSKTGLLQINKPNKWQLVETDNEIFLEITEVPITIQMTVLETERGTSREDLKQDFGTDDYFATVWHQWKEWEAYDINNKSLPLQANFHLVNTSDDRFMARQFVQLDHGWVTIFRIIVPSEHEILLDIIENELYGSFQASAATPTPTATSTFTNTPTLTYTPSLTPTPSNTLTATPTSTSSLTATFTATSTHTLSPTWTPTVSPTSTLTATYTMTPTVPPFDLSGTKIVFIRDLDLYIYDGATDRVELLVSTGDTYEPDISGEWVVYSSARNSRRLDVYLFNLTTRRETRLTTNSRHDRHPNFSPDGTEIAFASDRSGNWDVYTIDLDGSNLRQITRTSYLEYAPSWNPEGTQLVYQANPNRALEFFIHDLSNQQLEQLTDTRDDIVGALWSPGGDYIAGYANVDPYYVIIAEVRTGRVKSWEDGIANDWLDARTLLFHVWQNDTPSVYSLDIESGTVKKIIHNASWSASD